MAYIDAGNETITRKVVYCPNEIIIKTPNGVPYENFQIIVSVQKLILDPVTGTTLSVENAGTFSKLLSQIDSATVQAVELAVGAMLVERYGGSAQYGPMSQQATVPVIDPPPDPIV